MTNFHSPAYRADDIDAMDTEYLYREMTADHRDMTIEGLLRRIKRCREIGLDGLTYGPRRSALAQRVGKHAEAALKAKALGQKVAA